MSAHLSPFFLNHNMYRSDERISSANLNDIMQAINGNSGNALIAPAILKHVEFGRRFDGLANMFLPEAVLAIPPEQINERNSHLIMMMQDQIKLEASDLPWAELCEWLSKITVPVVPFGVGANTMTQTAQELAASLPKEMIRFLNMLFEKSISISTRGDFTTDVLGKLGIRNVKITGCPSFFAMGPNFEAKKPALTTTQKRSGKIAGVGLFACKEPERVHYFLQSEALFINALYGTAPPPHQAAMGDIAYPDYSRQSLAAYKSKRMDFHISPVTWVKVLQNNFIMACGTRVHGAIIALQAGIPVLCTAGDMRSKGLCSLFKIPHLPGAAMTSFSAEQIYELIDVGPTNQAYAKCYAQFMEFMTEAGLSPRYRNA